MLSNSSSSVLESLSHRGPSFNPLQPSIQVREVLSHVDGTSKSCPNGNIPRHESRVNIAVLASNEILLTLQLLVQHTRHPPDLIQIPVDGTLDLLLVENTEPYGLSEVWTLSGHLVVQPLLRLEVLGGTSGEANGVLLIVGFDEVFDDSAGFPEGDTGVRVFDGGDTAVGVEFLEGILFHFGELEEFGFVGELEFFEDGGHFPRVGTGGVAVKNNGFKRHCGVFGSIGCN